MSERGPVDVLVRVVGNNEFVTDPVRFPADVLRKRRNFDKVWDEFDLIIKTHFFQTPPPGKVASPTNPTILLQETTGDQHKWQHTRWSTFNWDEPHSWPDYFERNVTNGEASTIFVEFHIGWDFRVTGSSVNVHEEVEKFLEWENHLSAAGHGDTKLEEKTLKRVVIEGKSHYFVEDTWNAARWFPQRFVEPEGSCDICKAAAEEAGSFRKLRAKTRKAMAEYESASNITTGMGNISVGEQKDDPADVEMTG